MTEILESDEALRQIKTRTSGIRNPCSTPAALAGKPALPRTKAAGPFAKRRILRLVTRYRYDENGRLEQQILPDGHRLTYRYRPVNAVSGKGGQLQAILFDHQVVVSDIEQSQIGGLSGYLTGSGIRQRIKSSCKRSRKHRTPMPAGGNGSSPGLREMTAAQP